MTRGRLGAYALWQMRDYALHRGVPTLLIAALFLLQIGLMSGARNRGGPSIPLEPVVAAMLGPFVLVGALVAINGIVSHDRRHGYFRFLFAKPVSIPRYYVQAFLLHGAGLVTATALLLLAIYGVTGMVSPARTVLYPLVYYLLLGGLGFLFSATLRSEWVLIAATLVVTQVARGQWGDEAGPVGWAVRWLLPPFHVMDELLGDLVARTVPDWWVVGWPVLYGTLALAAGVLVLRRRAMGG